MKKPLALIPQPKHVTYENGVYALPRNGIIGIPDAAYVRAAESLMELFPRLTTAISLRGTRDAISIRKKASLQPEGYELMVTPDGIRIAASTPTGARHAVATLAQIVEQCTDTIPALRVRDWPDFAQRGLYYDVCRGRVPTPDALLKQTALLASVKLNQLQYYVKHTFTWRFDPDIGRGCGSLSPEEILAIDQQCADLGIEFIPSLPSFGHMDRILEHARYHDIAEDWGVGRYLEEKAAPWVRSGWSVSPANPGSYDLIDRMWAEFLPLFASRRFNICCDETYDLGWGQTRELCRRKGKGRVYLDHILKLRRMARSYGKKIMFWGDIIHNYPELIPRIPGDVTVLDWGYWHNHDVDRMRSFRGVGCAFMACPGTSSWKRLFPELHNANQNIARYVAAARRFGADGILNTDWGDGGHYNFMELSWYGYLFGAEQAWNAQADQSSFTERFCRLFLGHADHSLVGAVETLGEISNVHWQQVFFARPDEAPLTQPGQYSYLSRQRKVKERPCTSRLAETLLPKLENVRTQLAGVRRMKGTDSYGLIPYWEFATDTLRHAVRKQAAFGLGGTAASGDRRKLQRELTGLRERFESLWMARNKRSEIRVTLKRYDHALRGLR